MKRISTIILCITLIFGIAGCANKDEPSEEKADKTENAAKTEKSETEKADSEIIPDEEPEENESPTVNSGVNTEYLSLLGATKAEIDSKCGNKGEYMAEFSLVDYKCGLFASYDQDIMQSEPYDANKSISLSISLDKLLFNCPDSVTFEDIKNAFGEAVSFYDEHAGEDTIVANYNGNAVIFSYASNLTKDSYGLYKIEPYSLYSSSSQSEPVQDFTGVYTDTETESSLTVYYRDGSWCVEPPVYRTISCEPGEYYKLTEVESSVYTLDIEGVGFYRLEWSKDCSSITMYQPEHMPEAYVYHFIKN